MFGVIDTAFRAQDFVDDPAAIPRKGNPGPDLVDAGSARLLKFSLVICAARAKASHLWDSGDRGNIARQGR